MLKEKLDEALDNCAKALKALQDEFGVKIYVMHSEYCKSEEPFFRVDVKYDR